MHDGEASRSKIEKALQSPYIHRLCPKVVLSDYPASRARSLAHTRPHIVLSATSLA